MIEVKTCVGMGGGYPDPLSGLVECTWGYSNIHEMYGYYGIIDDGKQPHSVLG